MAGNWSDPGSREGARIDVAVRNVAQKIELVAGPGRKYFPLFAPLLVFSPTTALKYQPYK
jgi:hypothetical protein